MQLNGESVDGAFFFAFLCPSSFTCCTYFCSLVSLSLLLFDVPWRATFLLSSLAYDFCMMYLDMMTKYDFRFEEHMSLRARQVSTTN